MVRQVGVDTVAVSPSTSAMSWLRLVLADLLADGRRVPAGRQRRPGGRAWSTADAGGAPGREPAPDRHGATRPAPEYARVDSTSGDPNLPGQVGAPARSTPARWPPAPRARSSGTGRRPAATERPSRRRVRPADRGRTRPDRRPRRRSAGGQDPDRPGPAWSPRPAPSRDGSSTTRSGARDPAGTGAGLTSDRTMVHLVETGRVADRIGTGPAVALHGHHRPARDPPPGPAGR